MNLLQRLFGKKHIIHSFKKMGKSFSGINFYKQIYPFLDTLPDGDILVSNFSVPIKGKNSQKLIFQKTVKRYDISISYYITLDGKALWFCERELKRFFPHPSDLYVYYGSV